MRPEGNIGRWAVCGVGRLGRIEGREELPWGTAWVGTGIDGRPWSSRNPHTLCDADAAFLSRLTGGSTSPKQMVVEGPA